MRWTSFEQMYELVLTRQLFVPSSQKILEMPLFLSVVTCTLSLKHGRSSKMASRYPEGLISIRVESSKNHATALRSDCMPDEASSKHFVLLP